MLSGLYFPSLRPRLGWAETLRGVLARLVVYGVAEAEGQAPAEEVLWETRVVAPLGEDAKRFQALLREMTGREAAVIRGQLLALASRPGRDRDEANAWRLTAALHRMGGGTGENLEKARAERLWQARLFLKLAEAVTEAEAEINQGLAKLAAKQAAMLQALQGEDQAEEPEEVLPLASLSRPLPRSFRLRDQLAAWAVFYLLDPGPEPLLLSDDPEAAILLADEVEKRAPGQVIILPELALEMGENDRDAVVSALQELLAGKVEKGRAVLRALAASPQPLKAGGGVPMSLRLQLLPGPQFRQVMAQLSGLPGEDGATALASPYVLVGSVAPGEDYL